MAQRYWLMKTEPETYSIDDLRRDKTTWWEGVRNYQARNFMTKDMSVGDTVLIYHSNAEPPGVVGVAKVSQSAQPDRTAQNPKSPYYDPKSTKENPRWECVQVAFESALPQMVSLPDIKAEPALKKMELVRPGSRLSIQPVTKAEFEKILKMSSSAPKK